MSDTVPHSHYPGLVGGLTEDVEAVAVLLALTARHLVTRGTGRPRCLHLEPRHLGAHAGAGEEQEREEIGGSQGSHGTCRSLNINILTQSEDQTLQHSLSLNQTVNFLSSQNYV